MWIIGITVCKITILLVKMTWVFDPNQGVIRIGIGITPVFHTLRFSRGILISAEGGGAFNSIN